MITVSRTLRAITIVTVTAATLVSASTAAATPSISLASSFSESYLGEGGTSSMDLDFTGDEYVGTPEPLTGLKLRFPAGTTLSNEGFPTCSEATLEQFGPIRCPAGSKAGPLGVFTGWVSFGNERVEEQGEVWPYLSSEGGILLYIDGHTPVSLEILASGHYEATPRGPALAFELPLIESVPGAPYASISHLHLELGAFHEEAGTEIASVRLPVECPEGSFSWSAEATFMGGASGAGEGVSACPGTGTRAATRTTLAATASPSYPVEGEAVSYIATVNPAAPSAFVPAGIVEFLEDGFPIGVCESVPVIPSGSSATASCGTSLEYGSHNITARYEGDIDFLPSTAAPLILSVHEPRPPSSHETGTTVSTATSGGGASTPGGVTSGGSAGGGASGMPSAATIHAALRSLLTPSGRLATLVKHKSYGFSFAAPSPGTVLLDWYLVPKGARVASSAKPVLIAAGASHVAKAGTARVTVALTAQGRRLLAHAKRVRLTAKASFTPTGDTAVSEENTFVLKH